MKIGNRGQAGGDSHTYLRFRWHRARLVYKTETLGHSVIAFKPNPMQMKLLIEKNQALKLIT